MAISTITSKMMAATIAVRFLQNRWKNVLVGGSASAAGALIVVTLIPRAPLDRSSHTTCQR